MRRIALFAVCLLLMHCVAFTWKVMPMSQEEITMFSENRWAISLVAGLLGMIAGALFAKEDD